MVRPLRSTRKRRPRKREVSRSFRIPPDVDRELAIAARQKRWSKSFLIREILCSWLSYRNAAKPHMPQEQDGCEPTTSS